MWIVPGSHIALFSLVQILNRGHSMGADHWSLGVLIHEMLTGNLPFYKEGMQQMDLFRAIVKGIYDPPRGVSQEAADIVSCFLTRDPSKRLGHLAGGEEDILNHPWFSIFDFDELRDAKVKPPFKPKIKNALDCSNFEDWTHLDDKTKTRFPALTSEEAGIFNDF